MKKAIWIFVLAICIAACLTLCACGAPATNDSHTEDPTNQEPALLEFENLAFADQTIEYDGIAHDLAVTGAPEGTTIRYSNNGKIEVGTYTISATLSKEGYRSRTISATLSVTVPSAQSVVTARSNVLSQSDEAYDFSLHLAGTGSYAGYSGTANAYYDGKYRYDSATQQIQFMRTTSGLLLYDATEYITIQGQTRLEVNANDKGKIKSVKVLTDEDGELTLINRPFAALVDALQANNLKNIQTAQGDYKFRANIELSANNALVQKALSIIGKQGTTISLKGVSLTNPVNGLVLYFNLGADKKLTDFRLSTELSFPAGGADFTISLTYSQKASNTQISLPDLNSVTLDKNEISAELTTISNAISAVKNSGTYSLDVEAINEFDPGLTTTATKDRYIARMFKHTYSDMVAFNHSYEYKTHHETDGKETYKYTIGNIQDGTTHKVSRKGTNTVTPLADVTVDTQFDYLTNVLQFAANDINCLKKETKNGITTFSLYLTDEGVLSIENKVLSFINSNDADGVIAVDNYFNNSEYQVKGAEVSIAIKNGAIDSVSFETEIKYHPVGGNYTDKNITLNDTLTIAVNEHLADAQKYEAPKKAEAALVGLSAAKYYIN